MPDSDTDDTVLSYPLYADSLDGATVYYTKVDGICYRCQWMQEVGDGMWWVVGLDLRNGRRRVFYGPQYFLTLAEVEAACDAFTGIEEIELPE